ncbi:beta-carotene ketolase [Polymorphobacter glacialis]|uniref:Beta-carotene ketolase n=1 Tax=Sandarakinorhabdus glacialis TaxID=1614636 RepID=A0A916ZPP2_9SPHN|nr:fatty acid desaturase [Polymorphobacter glacialis]GGE08014.1 beta-carotene ketolase [Polymorphobacter glacialis]
MSQGLCILSVLPHPLPVRNRSVSSGSDAIVSQFLAAAIVATWAGIHFTTILGHSADGLGWAAIASIVAVQTWLSAGLFIIAHDAMHGSLVPGRPGRNRAIGRLVLMMYAGLDYDRMLPAHHQHHRHTGTAADPDFCMASPRRATTWFLRFFGNYYSHVQLVRITAMALVYMALGASFLDIAVFWAVPALLALAQLFVFGTYLPHRHGDDEFADHHRARSGAGGIVSLISCFHFGGYHHEHHLNPGTPWWRLPSLRRS